MPFAKKVISGGISKDDIDKINKGIEDRFNALTSSQQQDAEVIGARVDFKGVAFNSLKERIDYTDKLLRDSTVSAIETESDFTTVEATSNGYFEDVKLEGKTLVNLSNLPSGDITLNNRVGNAHITPLKQLTSSDTLYLTFNCTSINSDSALGIIYSVSYKDDTPTEYKEIESDKTVGCKKVKIIPKSDIQHISIYLHSGNSSSASATISDVMLMYEKDYDAQNPPSYFEGLKSVGDGVDEIVVESVNLDRTKSDKKRLLYYNNETQTWGKPILRKWDSIEKHADGKYYYHIRSVEEDYTEGDESVSDYITDMTTTVKPLAQEKVYECANIDLITYANETNYIVESGAIVPRTTLKVHNNISNIVRELQIKVSTLEGYIQYVMLDALKNALNE